MAVGGDVEARVQATLDALRIEGGRVTSGRRAIVESLFRSGDHHVTADDLATSVQDDHPEVHLSTVYRTLESLERLGVVTRVALGPGAAVYHLADRAHHHLLCEGCGEVTEVASEALAPLAAELARRHGFTLSDAPLVLPGRCPACR